MISSRFKWNQKSFLELTGPTSAFIYFRNKRIDLLTGFPETYSFDLFLKGLESFNLQDKVERPRVYHFYYEFGLLVHGFGHLVKEDGPLVIEIEYKKSSKRSVKKSRLKDIPLKSLERPIWSEYKKAFQSCQEHLLEGDCYQLNLTYPYEFETEEIIDPRDICDFFFSQNNLGAYAHATTLHEELILSNSPECLFQFKNNVLFTMPIKGTMKRSKNSKADWQRMLNDKKEEGELIMITDLLRNDLNRLDKPRARVIKMRAPLLVPNLLHQYSLVSVKLENKVSMRKAIECLFPGGSVTGAPKKRVMEILNQIERYDRQIYCGSTLLCYGDKKVASINIRTAQIDISERLWRYGAGGGVTLLSNAVQEFNEMEAKVYSFLTLLKTPGY